MKPISQLKIYRSATSPAQVISTMLATINNPKRLLRGPRFSAKPSNGKLIEAENVSERSAVAACGNGLIDCIAKGGRRGSVAVATRDLLDSVKNNLFPQLQSHVTVSDQKGVRAYRKVLKAALAELNTTA
jgi:hypothetical protein